MLLLLFVKCLYARDARRGEVQGAESQLRQVAEARADVADVRQALINQINLNLNCSAYAQLCVFSKFCISYIQFRFVKYNYLGRAAKVERAPCQLLQRGEPGAQGGRVRDPRGGEVDHALLEGL